MFSLNWYLKYQFKFNCQVFLIFYKKPRDFRVVLYMHTQVVTHNHYQRYDRLGHN